MADDALQPLRILIVEDQSDDAELILHELRRSGFNPTWSRVDTEAAYLASLDPFLDVILADFNMPSFSATRALEILKDRQLDVPFIVVSGSIGEETVPWHPVASGMCDRNVNAADGVGSLKHEPRTHPAHADGRLVYNGADRDGQNGNPG